MTRIKTLLLLLTLALSMTAQDKLFTLEDLNFGGTNYANLQPKNMFLTWWGDQLVQTDVEECNIIDVKTGKKRLLFTLDDINKWAESDDSVCYVRHLMNATFPYPDKPLVAVGNRKAYILVDFKAKKTVWQDSISGQTANDWNSASRATAYVEDHQLYITDGQGKKHQLTTDGSREIVYGQSVHRDEFGITKGTFWSPDGQRLAFYRMDQSMVTDYQQVDIYPRTAATSPTSTRWPAPIPTSSPSASTTCAHRRPSTSRPPLSTMQQHRCSNPATSPTWPGAPTRSTSSCRS